MAAWFCREIQPAYPRPASGVPARPPRLDPVEFTDDRTEIESTARSAIMPRSGATTGKSPCSWTATRCRVRGAARRTLYMLPNDPRAGWPRSGAPACMVAVCGLGGATSSVGSGVGETEVVPRGLYRLRDRDGAVVGYERFSCAPGPVGWRYTAQVLAADGPPRRGWSTSPPMRPVCRSGSRCGPAVGWSAGASLTARRCGSERGNRARTGARTRPRQRGSPAGRRGSWSRSRGCWGFAPGGRRGYGWSPSPSPHWRRFRSRWPGR